MLVSREHGLNPTLAVCYYCHEPNGEIGLLGHNRGKEAPRYSVIHTEPCDKCKAHMKKGIMFVLSRGEDDKTPSGSFVVLKVSAVKRIINADMVNSVLKKRMAIISPSVWAKLGLPT